MFSAIHKELQSVPGAEFDPWYQNITGSVGSFVGSGQLIFPTSTDARLALQYELLRRVNSNRLSFIDFVHSFFSVGSRLDEHVYALNTAITRPMVREMEYRLGDIAENLPSNRSEPVLPAAIQIIQHATNVIQQNASGSNINQSANISLSQDLAIEFENLRTAIKEIESDTNNLSRHLEAISVAQELASSQAPKVNVIKTIFNSLPKVAAIGTITMTILKLLGV